MTTGTRGGWEGRGQNGGIKHLSLSDIAQSSKGLEAGFRYDGSAASDVPWAAAPTGGSKNLAYVNSDYKMVDADASLMKWLCCKKAANSAPYDPSPKFVSP